MRPTISTARLALVVLALIAAAPAALAAAALPPAIQSRIDEQIKQAVAWAADPAIVSASVARTHGLSPSHAAIDQDRWRALAARNPLVTEFTRSPAGQFLAAKRSAFVTEAFLSDASGRKIAFIAKPTNWSHLGMPKHDVPMTGQVWQGPIEIDESTGFKQLQIAVPVFNADRQPIGSLVIGLNISELLH